MGEGPYIMLDKSLMGDYSKGHVCAPKGGALFL